VRVVLGQGISLAEVLFSGKTKTNQIARDPVQGEACLR